jgi:hypothetical protein
MRQTTYLNVILTVNAVLLAGLVWTQLASRPLLAQSAEAQTSGADAPGIPNAGRQRDLMIRQLDRVNRNIESVTKLVDGGRIKVEVTNLGEIKLEQPEPKPQPSKE